MEVIFLHLTLLAYMLSWGFLLGVILRQSHQILALGTGSWATGLALHSALLLWRTYQAGRLPFTNLYESLLIFAWGIVGISGYIAYKRRLSALGIIVMPFAIAALQYASRLNNTIHPLPPALQSSWLAIHVTLAIISYGTFAVAGCSGILYLLLQRRQASTSSFWPTLDTLDDTMARLISCGFPCLLLVITTGAIWAEQAWGSYWSWDPKETWALITAVVYAIFVHSRQHWQWHGQRSAWFAVIGLAFVIFCYLGVNLLMSGLHSYGSR